MINWLIFLQCYSWGYGGAPSRHWTIAEPLEGSRDPLEARDQEDCKIYPRLTTWLRESRTADDTAHKAGPQTVSSNVVPSSVDLRK